ADDRLGQRQIPRARDRHNAIAGRGENMQLAEYRNIVEAGVRARVRDHHEAVVNEDPAAVGHATSPGWPGSYSDAGLSWPLGRWAASAALPLPSDLPVLRR